MDFLKDFNFWSLALSVLQILFVTYGVLLIKFNDFKHLNIKVDNLISKVDENTGKMNTIAERVSTIEGQLKKD